MSIKIFLQNPCKRKAQLDRGVVKSTTKRDMNDLSRSISKIPGATSARLFEEAGLPDVTKTTQNCPLQKVTAMKSPTKRSPLTSRHKKLRMEWVKQYLKTDMFTGESRAVH